MAMTLKMRSNAILNILDIDFGLFGDQMIDKNHAPLAGTWFTKTIYCAGLRKTH
jgi:hypothetical protein